MPSRNMGHMVLLFAIMGFLTGCPGGGGSGNGNSNDNDDPVDANPVLTVDIVVSPRTSAVRVVGFVDKGLVERGDAESHVTRWDFTAIYANGSVARHVQAYPRGTEITLVSDENQVIGTQSTPIDFNAATVPAQFVEWQGDIHDATTGVDKGVLFFTMNEDRTITASFDDMNPLVVRVIGGADGSGTLLDYDMIAQAPLTIPPVHTANARNINVVGTILTGQTGAIRLSGYFNDGTQMKLCIPADWPFTSWSGDGVISGRCVTVTFGQGTDVTLTFP